MLNTDLSLESPYYDDFSRTSEKAPASIIDNCVSNVAKATGLALGTLAGNFLVLVEVAKNNRDYAISSYMPEWSKVPFKYLIIPVEKATNLGQSYFDFRVGASGYSPMRTFYNAAAEEILFREIIQNQFLPAVASLLPKKIGKVFNHPISRVGISSGIFATAHLSSWNRRAGVMPQLVTGIVLGTVREATGSNVLPILQHTLQNLIYAGYAASQSK